MDKITLKTSEFCVGKIENISLSISDYNDKNE